MPGRKEDERRKLKRSAGGCESIFKYFKTSEFRSHQVNKDGQVESEAPKNVTSAPESRSVSESHVEESSCHVASDCASSVEVAVTENNVEESSCKASSDGVQTGMGELPCSSTSEGRPADIGKLVNASMTVDEVEYVIKNLTADQKYNLLRNHFQPGNGFEFPPTYDGNCFRTFQASWLKQYPWLVYSPYVDGGYCLSCVIFAKSAQRSNLGILVNKPFTKWHKKSEI
ncbi:Uncharacterised protein r2_g385 [Pycnogonum litorale]